MKAHARTSIGKHSFILPAFASGDDASLITAINDISEQAPFRQMVTPRGFKMAALMTNCGDWGWVSDRRGYRYQRTDPHTGKTWPEMPALFQELAEKAAAVCGFSHFLPDACLINRYHPGTGMGLHQDKDEKDFSAPIVSVSLGVPAIFLFGGLQRQDKPTHHLLHHGDVVVWGNEDRLRFHGIHPIKLAHHPLTGQYRYNLTFRRAV
ncbi:MAG: DNA oxidative demethylase AlkB [Methylophaga sp.]